MRNKELLSECNNNLDELKKTFCDHDPYIAEIKDFLELEPEFYEKYRKETEEFFIRHTDVARTYLNNSKFDSHPELRKQYQMILKATLCGKLKALKFHDGDLNREIGIHLAPEIIAAWETDMKLENRKNQPLYEDSSFDGIMKMGEQPHHTCMSYIDGSYAHCLLSYFDANKKIVYKKTRSGAIIARAVIRLTKATNWQENTNRGLSFIDVESETESKNEQEEYPVLFLEHMYTGCQDAMRNKLEQEMIEFAAEKAKTMNIKLVISNQYTSCADLEKERIGIYITRSKSGIQYLDSFNGTHTSNNDDYYKFSTL